MKIKEIVLENLNKINGKDATKIAAYILAGTLLFTADACGLVDKALGINNQNDLGNNIVFETRTYTEVKDATKLVNATTGEVTYMAPAGFILKGDKAYRYYTEQVPMVVRNK